ncbi:MAG: hypothetical protein PHV82_15345 [Victivallaceae bacterium]|nr:hypothetical protein [Victivallaceae bacterium]
MKYSAAIDLSGKFAGFALAETGSGKLLLAEYKPMHGRNSAGLSIWMLELMAEFSVTPAAIDRWTVGGGPGSFTGMRLAAALIEGITIGKAGVKTRCVPGAVALGDVSEFDEGEKTASVFDGRNNEILLFELIKRNGEMIPTGKTQVLDRNQAHEYFAVCSYRKTAALSYEAANIEKVLPAAEFKKISWAEHLTLEKLITCRYKDFDNDLTALVYIRPAVFS